MEKEHFLLIYYGRILKNAVTIKNKYVIVRFFAYMKSLEGSHVCKKVH